MNFCVFALAVSGLKNPFPSRGRPQFIFNALHKTETLNNFGTQSSLFFGCVIRKYHLTAFQTLTKRPERGEENTDAKFSREDVDIPSPQRHHSLKNID